MPITAPRPQTGTRATHAQRDQPAPRPHHGALDGARAEGAEHRARPRRVRDVGARCADGRRRVHGDHGQAAAALASRAEQMGLAGALGAQRPDE
eukprot:5334257-Pleurochrysis_carterae.AAC.1